MKLALLALVIVALLWLAVHAATTYSPIKAHGEGAAIGDQPGAAPLVAAPVATGRARPGTPSARPVATPTHASRTRHGGEFILDTTAYTWTGNRTASGIWPRPGVAASNMFPLGTRLLVEGIGEVIVEDRIGWGSQLDIYMRTEHECIQFGRRRLHVTVIR